eukprot:102633-Prymnesium_polylepis.2
MGERCVRELPRPYMYRGCRAQQASRKGCRRKEQRHSSRLISSSAPECANMRNWGAGQNCKHVSSPWSLLNITHIDICARTHSPLLRAWAARATCSAASADDSVTSSCGCGRCPPRPPRHACLSAPGSRRPQAIWQAAVRRAPLPRGRWCRKGLP